MDIAELLKREVLTSKEARLVLGRISSTTFYAKAKKQGLKHVPYSNRHYRTADVLTKMLDRKVINDSKSTDWETIIAARLQKHGDVQGEIPRL